MWSTNISPRSVWQGVTFAVAATHYHLGDDASCLCSEGFAVVSRIPELSERQPELRELH
jgi:hypothetical protein